LFIVISFVPLGLLVTFLGNNGAAWCRNQNCLMCEAVLWRTLKTLHITMMKQLWPITLLPRLSPVGCSQSSMLSVHGQTLGSTVRPGTVAHY